MTFTYDNMSHCCRILAAAKEEGKWCSSKFDMSHYVSAGRWAAVGRVSCVGERVTKPSALTTRLCRL